MKNISWQYNMNRYLCDSMWYNFIAFLWSIFSWIRSIIWFQANVMNCSIFSVGLFFIIKFVYYVLLWFIERLRCFIFVYIDDVRALCFYVPESQSNPKMVFSLENDWDFDDNIYQKIFIEMKLHLIFIYVYRFVLFFYIFSTLCLCLSLYLFLILCWLCFHSSSLFAHTSFFSLL